MTRWLALALVAALCMGCTERSSLFVENLSDRPVVVRVYFNNFGESFGFSVPPGARAWAWAPLDGRVSGPIAVFDASCGLEWHQELPTDGGALRLDAAGGIALTAADGASTAPSESPHLEYTDACAESDNPRGQGG